jgi:hypothetical protein
MRRICLPFAFVSIVLASACTTIEVSPVPAAGYPMKELCIERNPHVVIEDFLPVVEQAIARHGIATRVFEGPKPADCRYTLWYSARRRWDIKPRLGYAEFRVRFDGETIGTASYVSEPSLSVFKWRSTETLITPVVDRLFAQFTK